MADEHTYSLGIDLGTSNSAMTIAAGDERNLGIIPVPQVHAPNSVEERSGLPSAMYLPRSGEFEDGALEVFKKKKGAKPSSTDDWVVGQFARTHGAQSPDRLVTSAKSWLCNPHVDHHAKLLPWESASVKADQKVSPVDAVQAYLEHLKEAFKHSARNHPWTLKNSKIVLTVPASFDEHARQLTLEAADHAGLKHVTLMEEPQAAFYAWLEKMGTDWRHNVSPGDLVLVCDVGGGTSDFSLIAVTDNNGDLELERVSVGAHILLGGDNVDLALAYALRQQMEGEGNPIDDWQFLALVHGCRVAKEALFSEEDREDYPVAVPARGSSLIEGSVTTRMPRALLEQIVLEGFLPITLITAMPQEQARVGLREHGLAYSQDPVLSKHLALFLRRSRDNVASQPALAEKMPAGALDLGFLRPTAVLFNGGFFKARQSRERILDILKTWSDGEEVRELEGSEYDLAVSQGACYYGLTQITGKGIRIRAGAARSYYLGLETTALAIPGFKPAIKAICVVPQGMEEGSTAVLEDKEFALVLGEKVSFRFFSSNVRAGDVIGQIVDDAEKNLEETAAMQATMEPRGGLTAGSAVPVQLHCSVTETGSLELYMKHATSEERWHLTFNVRTE